MGVVHPQASGLGGGAFLLARGPNGRRMSVNAREMAPAGIDPSSFLYPNETRRGGRAVGVPLELAGLYVAWRREGRLPWSQLVAPAAQLARSGILASPSLVLAIRQVWPELEPESPLARLVAVDEGRRRRPPRVGERCCARPRLAGLLEEVARDGPGALYTGQHAEDLVREIGSSGGVMTLSDLQLAGSKVLLQEPAADSAGGFVLLGSPLPASGPLAIFGAKLLASLEGAPSASQALTAQRTLEARAPALPPP